MRQILNNIERKKIRAEIYRSRVNQKSSFKDGKVRFFTERYAGKRVLDLGSVDHFEENWKSKYWLFKGILEVADDLVGLDYYKEGVDALVDEGFNVVHADAQRFNLDDKFDVVTAGDLIEHIPNLEGFIKSIRDSLNENGIVVLSTPNPWCWKYLSYHLIFGKLDRVNKEHVSWFCLQTIENLFARFGFEIVGFSFTSRRFSEKVVPLPARLKHTTLNVELRKSDFA